MLHAYWPMFDLRLRVANVLLRPIADADLPALADLLPPDVELDPSLPTYEVNPRRARGAVVHQGHWRNLGTWRPESWRLDFAVFRDGELIGLQDLEAHDFPMLKTVETSSWLALAERGRGTGKAMRRAVLTLAFDGLGAQVAETEAWHDNLASLGVSRSLGYVDNGVTRHARGDRADDMVRMRLTRARWAEQARREPVEIVGLEACLPYFGARDVTAVGAGAEPTDVRGMR